jgi:glycerol-3-phosphate dehydrogenase (NAD(P)+)
MPTLNKAVILGAGSWGAALAAILPAAESVSLWARSESAAREIQATRENARYLPGIRLPENVTATADLASSLGGADCVVFAVPSEAMREVARSAAAHIPGGALIVSASKGLEDDSGLRMSEILGHELSTEGDIVALSGPNLAVEVARGIPTATVAASASSELARRCQELFSGPTFRVYTSPDIVGVELAGAMKNVIAIAAGICEGLGFGDNSRAALMTRGLAEITRLGVALSAQTSTFLGLSGVGDLIATASSRLSRNHRVGIGLGLGQSLPQVLADVAQTAEGVPTTRAICLLASKAGIEMPISEALYRVLFEGAAAKDSIPRLMLRPPREEADF